MKSIVIFMLSMAFVSNALADTITVCADGCDFTSINAAIAVAKDGDVIQLSGETYEEGGTIECPGINLSILGVVDAMGVPLTILDGMGQYQIMNQTLAVLSEDPPVFSKLTLRDLEFRAGFIQGSGNGAGFAGSNCEVTNCRFVENAASGASAVSVVTFGPDAGFDLEFLLDRCVVSEGSAGSQSAVWANGKGTVRDCLIDGPGVLLRLSWGAAINGGRIRGRANTAGIYADGPAHITGVRIEDVGVGIQVLSDGVQIEATSVFGTAGTGIHVGDHICGITNVSIQDGAGRGLVTGTFAGVTLANSVICGHPSGQIVGPYTDLGGNSINEVCDCLDSDGDGICDEYDECPGATDVDTDGDGVVDCLDNCPLDPDKIEPGTCGCGIEDTMVRGDFNCDGVFDEADYIAMGEALGTCPGDLNGDGEVSGADLGLLLILYGTYCP